VSQFNFAVRFARTIGLCLAGTLLGSCGTDRVNPAPPDEYIPEAEPVAEDSGVRSEDISVLGSVVLERNRPVEGSSDTIIYTPAEEPKKVPVLTDCTPQFQINSATNPFLAGMPNNTSITYPSSTDRTPRNAPAQVMPTEATCLQAGTALYFKVDGRITFDARAGQESNADGIGTKVVRHTLGNVNKIAMTTAPINSLIGIFLDATVPSQKPNMPPSLDFSTPEKRNFKTLAPALGQIFFIGDGKDGSGTMQAFVVPQGATRLYVAIMDEYEWNNNVGRFTVTTSWLKP
jgi:hypothetical protein